MYVIEVDDENMGLDLSSFVSNAGSVLTGSLNHSVTAVAAPARTNIWGQINEGLSTGANILTTYWQGQEAVNRAQANAQAAKYGAASYGVATASADLSTLTVPLLGAGALIALAIMVNQGKKRSR